MQVTWRQPNPGLRLPTALIFSLLLCVPAERVHEVLREFPSCSGGTIHLDGLYRTSYVEFPEDCELIGARGTEVVLDGSVHFLRNATLHGSIAFRGGGAERCVDVEGSLDFVDPDIEFTDCGGSKVDDGGALYVEHSLNIHNGNITFRNSTATDGGCLFVGQDLQMHGGSMRFEGCQARDCGGALYVMNGTLSQSGGQMLFRNCAAVESGGAIYSQGAVMQKGGVMNYTDCRARGGGAVHSVLIQQGLLGIRHPASMFFQSCRATHGGGAMQIQSLVQNVGFIGFTDGSAAYGGCLEVYDAPTSDDTRHWSDYDWIHNWRGTATLSGTMEFDSCHAAGNGGAVLAARSFQAKSSSRLSFRRCSAFAGGALHVSAAGEVLGTASFFNVTAGIGSVCTGSEVSIQNAIVEMSSAPQIVAELFLFVDNTNFTNQSLVELIGWERIVRKVFCPPGSETFRAPFVSGCALCKAGHLQLAWTTVRSVTPCIPGAEEAIIESASLRLPKGFMVERHNLSYSLKCPNRNACVNGQVTPTFYHMCAPGYEGPGCSICSSSYGPSDTNAQVCMRCEQRRRDQYLQIAQFILQDIVVFMISAAGVSSATSQRKESSVFTNQFMSFVAVAAPVLQAVRRSSSFAYLLLSFDAYIDGASSVMQLGDVSSSGICTSCLLGYLTLPSSYGWRMALTLLTPSVCVVVLALMRGARLALVVGVNCFSAKICMCLGQYLVCYRMQPPEIGGELICVYAQSGIFLPTLLVLVALICVAGPLLWVVLIQDKANSETSFCLYLTASYKEELRWWEVTRLVRKIALALLCSAYPVTLHPFTLMTGMGLVLVIALVLELKYEPYKAEAWNRSEHWLLMTSMILVLITIYQHSIELTWSHSVQETSQVLCVILSLVFVPAYAQLYLVTKHLLQERFPKA